MNKKAVLKVFILAISILLCISITGCQSKDEKLAESRSEASLAAAESRQASEEAAAAERKATGNKIADIINKAPAADGWALSIGEAITQTFHDYDWDFEVYPEKADCYIVTFTGTYSPNPVDIPNLSMNGEISFLVDTETKTAKIHKDPDGISSCFILLAVG